MLDYDLMFKDILSPKQAAIGDRVKIISADENINEDEAILVLNKYGVIVYIHEYHRYNYKIRFQGGAEFGFRREEFILLPDAFELWE